MKKQKLNICEEGVIGMKKLLALLLSGAMVCSMAACGSKGKEAAKSSQTSSAAETRSESVLETAPAETAADSSVDMAAETSLLTHEDWAEDVKTAVNAFIVKNGKSSPDYDDTAYVVTDFDNTCSIFDVEEQLASYQLQVMAFALTPETIRGALETGLSDLDAPREGGAVDGMAHSYREWIGDIEAAYGKLYETYGPFTPSGLDEEAQARIQEDDQWKEFATKMRAMYDVVYDNESADVAYPWVLYWFTGMTEDEVYALAKASHSKYKAVETTTVSWESPETVSSSVGKVAYEWTSGIQVSENTQELLRVLQENGIKVWVCSASHTDVIRAAVDVWGMHDSVTGILAMTNKMSDGRYVNEYDYDTGYAWISDADGGWRRDSVATGAQTQGAGKVTAIDNVLVKLYGHGPIAGFMDSTGDFDFCTVYQPLQLVICFNRANRKITDGGGLAAEVAMYERDTLKYDFEKAMEAGDTLYLLQGRDENGMRTLRSSNRTLRLGSQEEQLFANEDNEAELQYMIDHKMTVEDIFNTFAVKTEADEEGNVLGLKYGFSKNYAGYHTAK